MGQPLATRNDLAKRVISPWPQGMTWPRVSSAPGHKEWPDPGCHQPLATKNGLAQGVIRTEGEKPSSWTTLGLFLFPFLKPGGIVTGLHTAECQGYICIYNQAWLLQVGL